MSDLAVLEGVKTILSDKSNWCPKGVERWWRGRHQTCFIIMLHKSEASLGIFLSEPVRLLLRTAAKEKLKLRPKELNTFGFAGYNDGRGRWAKIPAKERWKTLNAILDRAIELAKSHGTK